MEWNICHNMSNGWFQDVTIHDKSIVSYQHQNFDIEDFSNMPNVSQNIFLNSTSCYAKYK